MAYFSNILNTRSFSIYFFIMNSPRLDSNRNSYIIKGPGSAPRTFFSKFKFSKSHLIDVPPPKEPNIKTLLLDLDETLIHHSTFPPHSGVSSFKIDLFPDEFIFIRPYAREFMTAVEQIFDVFIFTSSQPDYANMIIDHLFPEIDNSHRVCRDKCILTKDEIKKDIKTFGRPLSDIIMVDNSTSVSKTNPENTLLITTWNGTPDDVELMQIILPILNSCSNVPDVRTVLASVRRIKRNFLV